MIFATVSGIYYLKNKKFAASNSLLKANILALADGTETSSVENENNTGVAKIVKTGASLYVTNISGTASGQVKIGMPAHPVVVRKLELSNNL